MGGVANMKLKDCVKKDKRIILFIHPAMLKKFNHNRERDGWNWKHNGKPIDEFEEYKKYGWVNREKMWEYKWPNALTAEVSLKKNTDGWCHDRANDKNKFFGSQLIVTPGKSLCKPITGCFAVDSLRVDKMTSGFHKYNFANHKIKETILANKPMNWNIMIFDFIETAPYLNRFILGMNYSNFELKITSALIQPSGKKSSKSQVQNMREEVSHEHAITNEEEELISKLNQHIVKGNSLYIIDFEEDLKLGYEKGQFAIGYCFVKKEGSEGQAPPAEQTESTPLNSNNENIYYRGIAAFEFNTSTKFLLNIINCKTSGYVWKDSSDDDKHFEEEQPQHRLAVNEHKSLNETVELGKTGENGCIVNGNVIKHLNFEGLQQSKQYNVKSSDLVMEYKMDESGKIRFSRR